MVWADAPCNSILIWVIACCADVKAVPAFSKVIVPETPDSQSESVLDATIFISSIAGITIGVVRVFSVVVHEFES